MSEHHDNRTSEEIQRDIQRTRADMSETIDALKDKFSPGQLLDQTLDYFRGNRSTTSSSDTGSKVTETASQWASDLGETVKNNPVPVALIGAGLAWLMFGGSSRHVVRPAPRTYDYEGSLYDPYNMPVSRTPVVQSSTSHVSTGRIERSSSIDRTAESQPSTTSSVRERTGEMASGVQHQLSAAGERVSEMAASARDRLSGGAGHLRHQMHRQGGRTQDTFNYLRDEQPLVLGALGFALGAALGAGLPSTQREDELMGETRDQVVHRAQELGEEQLTRAKQVASAAGNAALDQAEKEGLTHKDADETLRGATEKIERVANASVEAAKQEAGHTPPAAESTRTNPRS